jgi:hypothetical protein
MGGIQNGSKSGGHRLSRPELHNSATLTIDTLSALKHRYRAALSGAVVAKAHYLAQAGERFATPAGLERARWRWERLEARRQRLAEQLEDLHRNLTDAEGSVELAIPESSQRHRASEAPRNATLELGL